MAGGLRYPSVAAMPEGMRRLAADKLVSGVVTRPPVAGDPEPESNLLPKQANTAKYHNVKTEVNGIKFDSKKEARRYLQLMAAMDAGVISDLRLQVEFTLVEAFTKPDGERVKALRYKADFTYKIKSAGYDAAPAVSWEDVEYWRGLWPGAMVIEDVKSKGTRTRVYINKLKMMANKGYTIREV